MTMGEGEATNVGGVSFNIGIDLAAFEEKLAQAEQLARERAAQIQHTLGSIPTSGDSTGSSTTGQPQSAATRSAATNPAPLIAHASIDFAQYDRDLERLIDSAQLAAARLRQILQVSVTVPTPTLSGQPGTGNTGVGYPGTGPQAPRAIPVPTSLGTSDQSALVPVTNAHGGTTYVPRRIQPALPPPSGTATGVSPRSLLQAALVAPERQLELPPEPSYRALPTQASVNTAIPPQTLATESQGSSTPAPIQPVVQPALPVQPRQLALPPGPLTPSRPAEAPLRYASVSPVEPSAPAPTVPKSTVLKPPAPIEPIPTPPEPEAPESTASDSDSPFETITLPSGGTMRRLRQTAAPVQNWATQFRTRRMAPAEIESAPETTAPVAPEPVAPSRPVRGMAAMDAAQLNQRLLQYHAQLNEIEERKSQFQIGTPERAAIHAETLRPGQASAAIYREQVRRGFADRPDWMDDSWLRLHNARPVGNVQAAPTAQPIPVAQAPVAQAPVAVSPVPTPAPTSAPVTSAPVTPESVTTTIPVTETPEPAPRQRRRRAEAAPSIEQPAPAAPAPEVPESVALSAPPVLETPPVPAPTTRPRRARTVTAQTTPETEVVPTPAVAPEPATASVAPAATPARRRRAPVLNQTLPLDTQAEPVPIVTPEEQHARLFGVAAGPQSTPTIPGLSVEEELARRNRAIGLTSRPVSQPSVVASPTQPATPIVPIAPTRTPQAVTQPVAPPEPQQRPNYGRGVQVLDRAQQAHSQSLERDLGLPRELARAVAANQIDIRQALTARQGGPQATAALLANQSTTLDSAAWTTLNRQQQARAEQQARASGAPFSQVRTTQLIAPRGFSVPPAFQGPYRDTSTPAPAPPAPVVPDPIREQRSQAAQRLLAQRQAVQRSLDQFMADPTDAGAGTYSSNYIDARLELSRQRIAAQNLPRPVRIPPTSTQAATIVTPPSTPGTPLAAIRPGMPPAPTGPSAAYAALQSAAVPVTNFGPSGAPIINGPAIQARLYGAQQAQQQVYAQAVALAGRQGRFAAGGPQGPGGPPLIGLPPAVPPPPAGGTAGAGGLLNVTPVTGVRALSEAIFGVGLRYGVVVTAARLVHEAIADSVESAVKLEEATRKVGVAYGANARVFAGQGGAVTPGSGAEQFARSPQTAGTTTDYLAAVASAAPLAAQMDLNAGQVNQLVIAEGKLARMHGMELPQAAQILQSVLHGNLQAGEALDLQLTDQYGLIRGVGLSWDQLVQAQGPAAATATLLSHVQEDVNRQLQNNANNADESIKAFDRLGKAWDNFRNKVAQGAEAPVSAVVNRAADIADKPPSATEIASTVLNPIGIPLAITREAAGLVQPAFSGAVNQTGQEAGIAGGVVRGVEQAADAAKAATTQAVAQLTLTAQSVTLNAQNVVQQTAGQVVDNAQKAATTVASTAGSVSAVVSDKSNEIFPQLPAPIQGALSGIAGQFTDVHDAISSNVSELQQTVKDVTTDGLDKLPGPFGEAAKVVGNFADAVDRKAHDLSQAPPPPPDPNFDRTNARLLALNSNDPGNAPPVLSDAEAAKQIKGIQDEQTGIDAREQQRRAGLQTAVAQSRLDVLTIQADQRKLAVAGSINDLTRERLNLQGQLAPMLLVEQSLQDQIRVTTRENLNLTQARLEAQLAAIAPQRSIEQTGFVEKQAGQRAALSIFQGIAGEKPTYDINDQVQTILKAALDPRAAEARLADVEAQHQVSVTSMNQTQDQLQKQIQAIPEQQQLQNVELAPGGVASTQLAISANDASAAAIDRSLQLTNLLFSPEIIAAEQALADARLQSAQAAGSIANLQAGQSGGIGPVQITVDLSNLNVGQDTQNQINAIVNAAQQGVYDGLSRAASLSTPRVDQNVAAGR